jgi:hypothetical protein
MLGGGWDRPRDSQENLCPLGKILILCGEFEENPTRICPNRPIRGFSVQTVLRAHSIFNFFTNGQGLSHNYPRYIGFHAQTNCCTPAAVLFQKNTFTTGFPIQTAQSIDSPEKSNPT